MTTQKKVLATWTRTSVRGVGNSVVGTLPCHASIWRTFLDFGPISS
uniref:Uncharacterized protein n=1 Tax=Siphoviridae sp. ctnPP24 TaxID=2825662 RepID=A0A8S5TZ83_9CAUD|nr:MAG TPA: hypothetical protein [Siphoviridae sp. ctnPP24]